MLVLGSVVLLRSTGNRACIQNIDPFHRRTAHKHIQSCCSMKAWACFLIHRHVKLIRGPWNAKAMDDPWDPQTHLQPSDWLRITIIHTTVICYRNDVALKSFPVKYIIPTKSLSPHYRVDEASPCGILWTISSWLPRLSSSRAMRCM